MKLRTFSLVLLAAALPLAAAAPAAAEGRAELLAAVDPLVEPYPVPEAVVPIGLRAYGLLPAQLLTVGDRTFFIADDREHGVEPWVTDGTAEGTRRVFDLAPNEASSFPRFLGGVNGRVVFWAFGHTAERVLWSTDGTEGGTRLLSEIPSSEGVGPSFGDDWFEWIAPPEAPHLGGELLFTTAAGACELWATDGIALRRLDRLEQGSCGTALVVSNGRAYYGTWNGTWRTTDGVGEPEPLPLPPCSLGPLQIRGAVPFEGGIALSTYCGGVRGVVAVQRGGAFRVLGELAGRELEMVPDGGDLWLVHATGEVGFRVLRVRPAGHAEVVATVPGATLVESLGVAGGSLVVQAIEPERFWPQVWAVSPDGQAAPLTSQPLYVEEHWVRQTPEGLVFLATPEALLGVESHTYLWDVWTTGGSPETTRRVATFSTPHRGPDGRLRGRIAPHLALLGGAQLGGDLLLAADDGGGQQLRALRAPVLDPVECLAAPGVLCLGGGRFAVAVTFRDHHNAPGVEQTAHGAEETEDSASFWFFRPDNLEVLVKVLDGTPVNGHHWVFVGAMTDLAFDVEVTDTATGERWSWQHEQGSLCGTADTTAL